MRYIIISLVFLMCSCGFKQWAWRGQKNGWYKSDTITNTIITKESSKDTIFHHSKDTVFIHKDKLTVKYFYNPIDCTNYLAGKCNSDTIRVKKVINTVSNSFKEWAYWIIIAGLVFNIVIIAFLKK